ncbi:MAG: respiratory nitrate reductase subunit gamma [Nocardia sp.]|uniref:respiratory nitrate reductase subunit gamma n=1 Tax=Nocardia sp. TaxID=1821 RepID=UPI00261D5289|nr:respiratory nitrate reductase subunit gamma [Nocardia sp.]MCU1641994.1 respiratory nitrate reductase subunit gamma [Nocardia sp.]
MMYVLWVFLPGAAIASCIAGHIWRYRTDRFLGYLYGPHTDRAQRFGSVAFRLGAVGMFTARIAEVLLAGPHSRTSGTTHVMLSALQIIAVPLAVIGAGIILIPPLIAAEAKPRVTPIDRITIPVLIAALLSAVLITFDPYSTDDRYRTAETLFTWSRSLVGLHPNPGAMEHAPVIYQARGLILMLLIAIWPYTRLAGIFTIPLLRLLRRIGRVAQSWQLAVPRRLRHSV